VFYLDLDRFKAVNDTLGHAAGDELLKAAGARIRRRARESDTVARMGGDEFTVLLPKIGSREDIAKAAQKLNEALSSSFQLHLAGQVAPQEVGIGCSIGIAVYPGDAQDIDSLIKAADTAMYEAKRRGGGRYVLYSEELHGQHDRRPASDSLDGGTISDVAGQGPRSQA